MSSNPTNQQRVQEYYLKLESRVGYRLLLKGVRHLGYTPKNSKRLSIADSQIKMMDLVANKLALKQGARVLDAGCGEGQTAIHLANNYSFNVEGTDLLKNSIRVAQRRARRVKRGSTKFSVGDFSELTQASEYFDGVFALETFTHSPEPDKTVKEFARVLKSGGKLVIVDYETAPLSEMDAKARDIIQSIGEGWSAPGLLRLHHGDYQKLMEKHEFKDIVVQDVSANTLPFMKYLRVWSYIPALFVTILRLGSRLPNIYLGRHWPQLVNNGYWRVVIVSATKR